MFMTFDDVPRDRGMHWKPFYRHFFFAQILTFPQISCCIEGSEVAHKLAAGDGGRASSVLSVISNAANAVASKLATNTWPALS